MSLPDYTKINTDDCWIFAGQKNERGYGKMWSKHKGKTISYESHRVMYEAVVGPIPEGLTIDHLCRVKSCINPIHLEPVTRLENTFRSKPGYSTHCNNGHLFTEETTMRQFTGNRSYRRCRVCHRVYIRNYMRKWRKKQK